MDISLTPELENAVKAKVQSGLCHNASEVVREALRQSLIRERENEWLIREAAIGFAQLEAGQTVMVESKEQFMALVREESKREKCESARTAPIHIKENGKSAFLLIALCVNPKQLI